MKKTSSHCFESISAESSGWAKICEKESIVSVEIKDSSAYIFLNLSRSSNSSLPTPAFEFPQEYTSAQLRDRARYCNFTSRLDFEKVVQAKLNMKLRYLNLLPHFSTGSIVALATYSGVPGLITTVGDIAPFLLPTRWLQARESSHLMEAQKWSSRIMQLDSMQIVEGLSLAVGRDQIIHEILDQDRDFKQK